MKAPQYDRRLPQYDYRPLLPFLLLFLLVLRLRPLDEGVCGWRATVMHRHGDRSR